MRRFIGLVGRRRSLTAGLLAISISLIWVVAAAADAPDGSDAKSTLNGGPVSPAIDVAHGVKTETCSTTSTSIPASICTATNGKAVKVTVAGGWVWYTHGSDCNTDRAGVGFAVDWFDPTDQNADGSHGNSIGKSVLVNSVSKVIGVGVKSGNALNPADNVVHPTPNETSTGSVDDITNPSLYLKWRGGCGHVTAAQPKLPRGTWGPRNRLWNGSAYTTLSAPDSQGLSHIYAKADDITTLCVVTYDVHGGTYPKNNLGVGIPKGAAEVTAGGASRNIDNGVEKNSGTPLGNACPPITVPQPQIHIEKLPKNQSVPNLGTALFTIKVSNTGNTSLTGVQITDLQTPAGLGSCAGALSSLALTTNAGWDGTTLAQGGSATYDCFLSGVTAAFTNIATACGNGGGATVCDDAQADVAHRADVGIEDITSNQDFVPNDRASLTGATDPQQKLSFSLYMAATGAPAGGDCSNASNSDTLLLGPLAVALDANNSSATANALKLSELLPLVTTNTAGTYYWKVAYPGDTNLDGTQRNAAFSECNETFVISNG
jgi:uncharacterized repeat protein (TIGR01451 family)